MRISTALAGTAILALTSVAAISPAAAAECFDSGTNYPCTVERDADGSFTIKSAEHGETIFLVDDAGEAERINYEPSLDRSFRGGYYRALKDTPGCWQDQAFEDSIFCVWE